MRLTRHTPPSSERERLGGRTERLGSATGMSTWGAFLFGAVFVATGSFIVLIGTRVVAVDPSSVHAPFWVLTVAGGVFAIAGLFVWQMGWVEAMAAHRRERAQLTHANNPALIDYDWDPHGFQASRWQRPAKALAGAAFVTLFLSIFNYWAFFMGGPWMVKGITALFDLIAVFAWIETVRRVLHAVRFGNSQIRFDEFPYRPGASVVVRWTPARSIRRASAGRFTLRCVEESFERRGAGRGRSSSLAHTEVWRDTLTAEGPYEFGPGEQVVLRFEAPEGAPGSNLSGDPAVFWELDVQLALPGLDFAEQYLVPVYANSHLGAPSDPGS